MRSKSLKKNKVNIVTLGCSKNVVDSEVMMGQLRANQFDVEYENESTDARIVIINTCGFIDNAKQQSIDMILYFVKLKQQGIIEKLIVTGCLSQRYKHDLEKEIPDVDHFFGTNELPRLLKTLGADYQHELVGERLLTTPSHYAYLKISEGCDRTCSFCAIPLMRGQHTSKPMERIIEEAKSLVAKGSREIILIAQDSTYYGLDLYKKRNLAELLGQLAQIDGIEWLRLHYLFPSGFPLDVLDVIAERKNICRYIDIPLQHASDKILASMRRGTTRTKTQELIQTIRRKIPGVAIRTTLITGYPGETEDDFNQLCEFISEMRFDRMGVFTYSHEENTRAFELTDNIPIKLKQQRAAKLMKIQQQISEQINASRIGSKLKVVIDRKDGRYFSGRTEFDSPEVDNDVWIESENNHLKPGDFITAKITGAEAFDLFAVPVD
ncbi:MAG: 30S ribosomal protein S12 methylthiotransferase RimO [Bacteroidia bacterium]|nr:30S ribosomal protein S12 methylthiotransferase RimO [Bacteroidia bacterium]MCZ2276590.1 30S ribosomal protein S12 methylthiotransferase RimO [Bacteroidia bacterium]